jgi:hypothetical protein
MAEYIDPQDVNRDRQARVRAEQDVDLAQKRTEVATRDVRLRGMFKDERRVWLDSQVQADLTTAQGHVAPPDLKAAQDEAWSVLEPVIFEVKDRPLSLAAVKEIVSGLQRGSVTEERKAQLMDLLASVRSKVFETKATKLTELVAMNAQLAKERPGLNALLAATGAGNSVPLARELLAEAAEREQKRRPFASLLRK